jgi:anti-anti-sigma factor
MIQEPYPVLWAGQRAVVVLPGHMDLSNAAEIRSELLAVINRCATVMIADMSATVSCDHSGAEALSRAYQRAVVSGTDLRLVVTSEAVRHEITISGLDWLVPVHPSLEQALTCKKQAEWALTPTAHAPARAGAAGQRDSVDRARPVTQQGPVGAPTPDPDVGTEIALLDRHGVIVSVNRAWQAFATANHGDPSRVGPGVSYLNACAAAGKDPVALKAAAAIRQALKGDLPGPLKIEVPCHSADTARWFDMLISTRVDADGKRLGATVTLALARSQPLAGPAAREGGSAAPLQRRAEPPGRVAAGMSNLLVHRLFSAGLSLEAALQMLDDHPAAGRIRDAVTDLDQAIREVRSFLFDQTSH